MEGKALARICFRYAVVAGLLTAVSMIIMFYVGHHPFLIAPFLDFRILVLGIFIFFALKEFRDEHQQGVLYFWQGLIGSFIVVFSSSLLASLGLFVFGLFEHDFINRYIAEMTAYLNTFPPERIEQLGKEVYDRNLALLPATNVFDLVITYFVQGMIIGFFISIILSVILRKQPQTL